MLLPVVEGRHAGDDDGEAGERVERLRDERAQRDVEGREDEDNRRDGVSPRAVRPRQVRLRAPQDHDSATVRPKKIHWPKIDVGGQLLERAGDAQERRPPACRQDGDVRRQQLRVQVGEPS